MPFSAARAASRDWVSWETLFGRQSLASGRSDDISVLAQIFAGRVVAFHKESIECFKLNFHSFDTGKIVAIIQNLRLSRGFLKR